MVRYCLEMPNGGLKHFPAGTYNEQMRNGTGRDELNLMGLVHSVLVAFKYVPMREWGESERYAAGLSAPVKPIPAPPTRKLDSILVMLWRGSWWADRVNWNMRRNA